LQPTLAGFARVVEARFVALRPRHLFSLGNPRWVRFAKSRFAKTSVGLFGQNFQPLPSSFRCSRFNEARSMPLK
jgi:hypothetical protein